MAAFWKFGRYVRDFWKVMVGGENDDLLRQIRNMEEQLARLRQRKLMQDKEREVFALNEARDAVKKIQELHDSLAAADVAITEFTEKLGKKARGVLEVQMKMAEKYQAAALAKQKQFVQEHAKKAIEGNAAYSSLEILGQLGEQGAPSVRVENLDSLDQEKPRCGAKTIQVLPDESIDVCKQDGDLTMQAKALEGMNQEGPGGVVEVMQVRPEVSRQFDEQETDLLMQVEKVESIRQEGSPCSTADAIPMTGVEPNSDTGFKPWLGQGTEPSSKALASPKKKKAKTASPASAPTLSTSAESFLTKGEAKETRTVKGSQKVSVEHDVFSSSGNVEDSNCKVDKDEEAISHEILGKIMQDEQKQAEIKQKLCLEAVNREREARLQELETRAETERAGR